MVEQKNVSVLLLDDDKECHEIFGVRARKLFSSGTIEYVMTAAEAIEAMKTEKRLDVLYLDHDLDRTRKSKESESCHPDQWQQFWKEKNEEDGIAAAGFVANESLQEKLASMVAIHTLNRRTAQRMIKTMKQRLREVHDLPLDNRMSFRCS